MTESRAPFLSACRREAVSPIPLWLMRQAGRYLPEYQALRRTADFLTLCKTPELAAEVTLQPIRRFALDAAIIFCDILIPLEPMGMTLRFDDAPALTPALREADDVRRLRVDSSRERVRFLHEAIGRVRAQLPPRVPLIGFAGAPFTLANYCIEGGSSRENLETKRFLMAQPEVLHELLEKLTEQTIGYLEGQLDAGAQALQVFESSAGLLAPDDFEEFALPYARRVVQALRGRGVPVIYFARGAGAFLECLRDVPADVYGIDWQTPLASACERLGGDKAIQGNLDPTVLLGPQEGIRRRVESILRQVGNRPGFIFNLGHGVLKQTPPENVAFLVDTVHSLSSSPLAAREGDGSF